MYLKKMTKKQKSSEMANIIHMKSKKIFIMHSILSITNRLKTLHTSLLVSVYLSILNVWWMSF